MSPKGTKRKRAIVGLLNREFFGGGVTFWEKRRKRKSWYLDLYSRILVSALPANCGLKSDHPRLLKLFLYENLYAIIASKIN